ncbi:MAG: metal ABC transporter permease [Gammaproteobacteria bacterium]
MNLSGLDPGILLPGFLAGLIVLATHVPLGREVLKRGIIFIDLAIAQVAGLGVIAAGAAGWDPHGISAQVAAVGAALVAGFGLTWTETHFAEVQEAIIGALFILAATAGLILLANDPHGGEALRDLLVGQILWVDYAQLIPALGVAVAVLALWLPARRRLRSAWFYVLFAFSVTASVQLVGIYLVFASLILPALATRRLAFGRAVAIAYVCGAAGYAIGLVASALFDLPSGAVVVWALTGVALATATLSRRLTRA